jgi:bis(5'-nucleosyl)-tetraphosphatase (symmetrical)
MSVYAVGDIQGCFAALRSLLHKIAFDPMRDRLWFVGDLVNRGPQSLATLRYVKSLGDAAVAVLGNHDLHLLCVAEGGTTARAGDTLDEVLQAPDRSELLEWLRSRPMMHAQNGYAIVHAGLLPQWSVAQALELAGQVETALRAPGYRRFLSAMYGNFPDRWRDDLAGLDRLRVITNAMTRLRVCTPDGVMDLSAKGPAESAPPGFLPWYAVPGRKSKDATLICGHWAALGLRIEDNLLALDTGCVWGGSLTAIRLGDRALTQVSCTERSGAALPQ